jgi:hypothetical protein
MRHTLWAAVALTACAPWGVPAAHATARPCTVLTDPAADVQAGGAAQTAVLPDGHLDVRAVTVETTKTGLTVTIADTALNAQRYGSWTLTFRSGRTGLFVTANVGEWLNVGDGGVAHGFRAGVSGRRPATVTGVFDYAQSRILVVVPRKAFGAALPARGATLSSFAVTARERFADLAPQGIAVGAVELVDQGASATTYAVGSSC